MVSIRMVEDEDEDDNDGRKRQHLVPRHDPPTASVLHTVLWHCTMCTSHPPHWCCTLRRQLHTSVLHAHNSQYRYCCTQLHRYCTLFCSTSQCTLYFSTAHMYTTHPAWVLHSRTQATQQGYCTRRRHASHDPPGTCDIVQTKMILGP